MALSRTQRNILLYGAPLVAVIGIAVFLAQRSSGSGASTATAAGTTTVDNSPIGTDQLADFENQMTAALGQIQQEISAAQIPSGAQINPGGTVNAPKPITFSPVPTPAPVSTVPAKTTKAAPFNEYPVGTIVALTKGGVLEKIVQSIAVPGGYVDVTNLGGLYGSGVALSGSLYKPTPPPAGFAYSARINGQTVYEYGPTGVGAFKVIG